MGMSILEMQAEIEKWKVWRRQENLRKILNTPEPPIK